MKTPKGESAEQMDSQLLRNVSQFLKAHCTSSFYSVGSLLLEKKNKRRWAACIAFREFANSAAFFANRRQ
jgi:hypothetical protein